MLINGVSLDLEDFYDLYATCKLVLDAYSVVGFGLYVMMNVDQRRAMIVQGNDL